MKRLTYPERVRRQFQQSEKDPIQLLRLSDQAKSHALTARVNHEFAGYERGRPVYEETAEVLEAIPRVHGGASPIAEIRQRYQEAHVQKEREEMQSAIFGGSQ